MKRLLPQVLDIVRKYKTNNPNCLAKCIGVDVNYVNLSRFQRMYGMKAAYMKAGSFKSIIISKALSANERMLPWRMSLDTSSSIMAVITG